MMLRMLLLLAVLLAAPISSASAAPTVGISDNRPAMLADPLFKRLGTKQVRLVVSYNAVSAGRRGDDEISSRVAPYLAAAAKRGIDVHVAFEHARGDAQVCEDNRRPPQCRLPSVAAYKAEVTKFLRTFETVDSITAWNESNHSTQPTYRDPKRTGKFARAAEQACRAVGRKCTVVALDILDSANDPEAKDLNYSRTVRFVRKARAAYGGTPKVCGIHNYADVNRFRTDGTRTVSKALRCKKIWLTETGGLFNFASFWSKETKRVGKCSTAAACQAKAVKYLFAKTIKAAKNIERVYVYNFYAGDDGRFDAGIVDGMGDKPGGKPRPAYRIVKRHI